MAAPVGVPAKSRRTAARIVRTLCRPAELLALLEAVLLFVAVEACVRTCSLPRAARWFGATLEFTATVPGREGSKLDLGPADRRALSVLARLARRWPLGPRGACLRHSLAAAHVLRARDPRLRLAVGSGKSLELTAHAWIEVDGTAITDPGDYLPLLPADHVGHDAGS